MAIPTQAGVNQKVVNRATARVIPVFLAGIVGYVTWVVIFLVSVDYLLHPSTSLRKPRNGAAVAVLVVYSILLLLMSVTYMRLVCTIIVNPGYVSRGPQWYQQRAKQAKRKSLGGSKDRPENTAGGEKSSNLGGKSTGRYSDFLDTSYTSEPPLSRPAAEDEASPDLRDFFGKDVFTCEGNGKPSWCPYCSNWKPDRAHHCREVGRCVRKMDHFCPWVGGVVSETSFKFFVQFIAWTAAYCLFTLILMAITISELRQETNINVHYIITISLAALFALFTLGMTGSSLQFVVLNSTTIENLSRRNKVWQLAIHIPRPVDSATTVGLPTIIYPLTNATLSSVPASPRKVFAIIRTKPGENPWDLGPLENTRSVMGRHWYDWVLPLKHSPCSKHEQGDSQFALGPVVDRMRIEAGITSPQEVTLAIPVERRRKKRSRQDSRIHPTRLRSVSESGTQIEMSGHHHGKHGKHVEHGKHGVRDGSGIAFGATNGEAVQN